MSRQMLNEAAFAGPAARPAAGAVTMSIGRVIAKTFLLLAATLAFGAVGWQNADRFVGTTSGMWFLLGFFVLMGLTVAAANNPAIAMGAGFFYAVFQGLWMGSIAFVYETLYEGIVAQALLASACAFIAVLLLYSSRAIRVTGRLVQVIVGATFGILVLYLVGWLFMLFGAGPTYLVSPTPLGIGLSVAICVVAASNLFIDFAFIEEGVRGGAPASMEWYAAFGLLTTLVWLYIEILRLLALLRARR